jgi:peptidoglycan/xylan/chitin deacetylase (PgdA/CDA1 family)
MRREPLAVLLAATLAATSVGAVFAQGQPESEPFGWPIQEWQRQTEAAELTLPGPKVVRKGPPSSGAVALTFDDGHNAKACASIAETLRRHGAVGTFFINGHWLKRDPNRWRRILDGMETANHTRSHRKLTEEPHSVVVNQIRSNEYLHEAVLGRPMLKALRPPYGAYGDRVGRIAKGLGYDHVVMWNVDAGDWRPNAKPKRIIRAATGAAPGSIILMHCARDATAKALPKIVRHYQRRGIEVAGLSKVLQGAKTSNGATERYGG